MTYSKPPYPGIMILTIYEHQPSKLNPARKDLVRVSEPSDTTVTIILPLQHGGGNYIRTKNFFFVFYRPSAIHDDTGKGFLHDRAIRELGETNTRLGGFTQLLGRETLEPLELSIPKLDEGFSHLHKKIAAMKAELELAEVVRADLF
ncbi:MAG: hypothetical protein Q9221_000734 [Calogaya cf. arnoldii]